MYGLSLGNRAIEIDIYGTSKIRGTLVVGRAGVKWRPKHARKKRLKLVSYAALDLLAKGKLQLAPAEGP